MTAIDTTPPPPDEERRRRAAAWRPLAAAAAVGSVLLLTGFGVYATLTATATGATRTDAGATSLTLTLADAGAGFGQNISNIAPTDTVNRFVTLTNTGSLAGKDLLVAIASTPGANGNTALIDDTTATKALRIAIRNCTVAWTVDRAGQIACDGTRADVLDPTMLGALATATPIDVGALPADSGRAYLWVSAFLPDQVENTLNGNLPTKDTVQGASVGLAYTFTEAPHDARTTSSSAVDRSGSLGTFVPTFVLR